MTGAPRPLSRLAHAIGFAGKCAALFAPPFLVFLFAAILMVGDGTAPAVTHLAAYIIGLPVKLLGLSFEGAIGPAVVFWSMGVFVLGFLYAWTSSANRPVPEVRDAWRRPVVVACCLIGAVVLLIQNHRGEKAAVAEKAMALDFVRNNSEIMRMVGGQGRVDLVSYTRSQGKPNVYDIGVYGSSTLYAIVEPAGGTPAAFRLLCVTPLYMGQRAPFRHPCDQK